MRKSEHHHWGRRVGLGFAVLFLLVLLAARLYLGTWVLHYVNNVLQGIDGYQGSVASIDIDLYRGAYRINTLVLNKKTGAIPAPFVAIDAVDLSVQWSALFHGRVVSNITLVRPTINFAVSKNDSQTGAGVDWTKPIKDLAPIDINLVTLKDGAITYKDFSSTPQVDIYIHQMNGSVSNLRNVLNPSDPLPSSLDIKGNSLGGGQLAMKGRLNILKPVPDMHILTQLENVQLPALNSYSDAYAAFTFKKGDVDLYSDLSLKDSIASGYVKLLAREISVDVAKSSNPLQAAWSSVVAGVIKVFTNPSKDQFATRADIQGSLGNINTNIWSALASILENAFVTALQRGLDDNGSADLIKKDQ